MGSKHPRSPRRASLRRPRRTLILALAVVLAICAPRPGAGAQAEAPAGAPDVADLLRGYKVRPPWNVPGVDYAVGVPPGSVLRSPVTLAGPGISIDRSRHLVRVSGAGVRLTGIDFSRDGGWGVYLQGASGTVIEHSFLRPGPEYGAHAYYLVAADRDSDDLTITGSTLDGAGETWQELSSLIGFNGGGTLAVRLSLLTNAPQHFVEMTNSRPGRLFLEYNLMRDGGFQSVGGPVPHTNFVQFFGTADAVGNVIRFNTMLQTQPHGIMVGGGQMLQVSPGGAAVRDSRLDANVIIAAAGPRIAVGHCIAVYESSERGRIDSVDVTDNYVDASGAYGAFYPPRGSRLRFAGNRDLRTGNAIAPPAR